MLPVAAALLSFVRHVSTSGLSAVDPCQTLGLSKTFTDREVRRVHRRFIAEKRRSAPFSARRAQQFREIEFAFSLIGDPSSRALYEALGAYFVNQTDFAVVGFTSDIQMATMQRVYGKVPA